MTNRNEKQHEIWLAMLWLHFVTILVSHHDSVWHLVHVCHFCLFLVLCCHLYIWCWHSKMTSLYLILPAKCKAANIRWLHFEPVFINFVIYQNKWMFTLQCYNFYSILSDSSLLCQSKWIISWYLLVFTDSHSTLFSGELWWSGTASMTNEMDGSLWMWLSDVVLPYLFIFGHGVMKTVPCCQLIAGVIQPGLWWIHPRRPEFEWRPIKKVRHQHSPKIKLQAKFDAGVSSCNSWLTHCGVWFLFI